MIRFGKLIEFELNIGGLCHGSRLYFFVVEKTEWRQWQCRRT